MMKQISVIIPVYNAAASIERCLESVLAQTYKANYQIITINDGSTDDSLEIIERYIVQHRLENVTVIDKPNGGVSSARNAGLRVATGEWIALLDSDDEWCPNKIEVQMDILSRYPEIDLLGSNINDQQTRILWKLKNTLSPIKLWELFIKWHPQTSTAIFRNTILRDVGFYNESMRYGEDGEFFLRICMQKNSWFTPEQLVVCGNGKPTFGYSGLSANLKAMQEGQEAIIHYAYAQKKISWGQKQVFMAYSRLKYWRRVFIVWKRNH